MKKILSSTAILISCLTLVMCTGKSNEVIPVGSVWQVTQMELNGTAVQAPAEGIPTLGFADSTKIGGNAGCNYYFGNYTIEPANKIKISPMGMTRMACPDMTYESSFIQNLEKVRSYTLKDSVLTLCDSLGKNLMVLAPYKEKVTTEAAQQE